MEILIDHYSISLIAVAQFVKEKAVLIGLDETLLFDAVADDIEKKVRRLHMRAPEQDESE